MDYGDGGDYPGTVPEYGAIFMSNTATKKECLERKLLGLPSGQANFVRYVKAGMILFLFEFEKRELHGVYRACSDGAMNIVPHAFKSSGKQFPAQVRFSVIWDCKPLSEHEFRDAISENYYSNKKFNFGLSDDQVRRLLCLFSSRKLKNRVPRRQFSGETTLICKEESISEDKKFGSRKRGENFIEEYSPTDPINIEYNPNSTSDNKRSDDKRFRENSLGYDRVKRVVDDGMDLTDNQIEIGDNNSHNLRDSFYSSRRQSQDNQFLNYDTVDTEHTANEITLNRIEDFLARARRDSDDDDRFRLRDLKGNTNIRIDDDVQLRKPIERLDIPQTEFRTLIDDQMLLTNQVLNPLANLRRTSDDDGQHYINNMIEIGQTMDNRPIVSNRLHEVERGTDDQRRFPYEPFSTSLHYGENPNFQDRFSRTISMERRNLDDNNSLDPITLPLHSEHFLDRLKPSEDDNYKLQNSRGENAYSIGNNVGPPRYADLYQLTQQPSLNSSKPMMEAHYSLSQNQHKTSTEQNTYGKSYQTCFTTKKNKYEESKPTSHDSVLTRTSSYEQGFPPDVNGSSRSVQDFVAVTKSVKNSSYASTNKSLSQSNGASLVSEIPLHNDEDLYDHPHQRLSKSVLRGGCHKEAEQPSINHKIYENPLLFSRSPIYERGTLSPSIEFDEHTIASQGLSNHYFQEYMNDPQFSDDQDLMVNYGMDRAHSSSSFKKSNTYGIGSYEDVDEPDQNPLHSKKRRASVFARLSVSKSEQEHGNYMEYDELDASIDQVMESLFESLSHKVSDASNQSPLVEEYDTEESDMRYNQLEVDEPTMTTQKIKTKSTPAIEDEENDKDAPIETRVMDFKRRSESKRSRDSEKTKGSSQKPERKREDEGQREGEKEGKQIKRRKLVRPSFCVKEELNENNKGDGISDSELLLTHECSNGVVSGQSKINPNCPSPNSQANRKLVEQVLVKKEGLKDDCQNDGSDLQLPTHESLHDDGTTCGKLCKSQRKPNLPSPNSQSSDPGPSTCLCLTKA